MKKRHWQMYLRDAKGKDYLVGAVGMRYLEAQADALSELTQTCPVNLIPQLEGILNMIAKILETAKKGENDE